MECFGLVCCRVTVFCGLICGLILASYPQPPSRFGCTGVLWVLTRTHPCGPPPRQDGGGTRAPALTYVHTVCVYVAHVVASGPRGVGAVDTRTPPRTMSLALSFDLGCQVSNLCSQQQPNALLLAMLLSSLSWTSAGSVDSASFSSAGSSVFSLVHTLVLGDLNCLRFFSLVRALVLISTGGSAAGSAVVSSVGNSSWFSTRHLLTPSATCLLISLSEHSRC